MTGALRSQYALGELIGEGSSGSVYRVHSEAGGPQLVIKVLNPVLSADPDVVARARHLSGSLRSLRNPHLVAVKDLVIEPDMLAIVSEYVAGNTLAEYLRAQSLPTEATALSIVQQVLAGLAVAHGRGFFHGHLTSQQVLLVTSPSGQLTAKVSDLATVLLVRAAHIDDDPVAFTDLYAAGALLHEMLTGRKPVILAGRVNPSLFKPATVSPAVWGVVTRLLAREEAARPTDTWKELTNVERVLDSLAPEEAPATRAATTSAENVLPFSVPALESAPSAGHVIVQGSGSSALTEFELPRVMPAANLLPVDQADLLIPDYNEMAFGIRGMITPILTPSITNLPVLPDPVDGWVGYVPPEPKQGRVHRFIRTRTFVALACLALGGIAAGLIIGLSGGGTKSFTYFSADTSAVPGLQTTRSWTLTGGKHPKVHVLLEFHTTTSTSAKVDEVIPTSLLADGSNVTFHGPQPARTDGNHIVSYSLNTAGTQVIDASYDVAVPPKDFSMAALLGWSDEQRNEVGERYRAAHALTRISLPKTIKVTISRTIALPLTGLQKDGAAAPSTAFGGATYRVDNGRIAKIGHDGKLKGLKIGRTFVHVTLGAFTVSSTIYVVAPASKKSDVSTPEQAPLAVTTSAEAQDLNNSDGSSFSPDFGNDSGTTTNNGAAVGPDPTTTTKAPGTAPPTTPSAPSKAAPGGGKPTTPAGNGGGNGSGNGNGGTPTTPPTAATTQPTTPPTAATTAPAPAPVEPSSAPPQSSAPPDPILPPFLPAN